ncbi:MAG: methyltransferase domain-containing protein [Chloroflexi bacterium]|nr:methyltransferase domain-containing protein [Chloroflexota bacterium]
MNQPDNRINIFTEDTDWAKAWSERIERSGLQANLDRLGIPLEEFWKRYHTWQDILRESGYPGKLLEHVKERINTDSSILDIGAGAGTFAIPLAQSARLVTAVESSPEQISRLQERVNKENVLNITIVHKRWEGIDLTEIGDHDLVLASYCFQMKDIKSALEKMYMAASKYLVLIHTAGHDLLKYLSGTGFETGPDYTYLFNILQQSGYRAYIEIITRNYSIPLDIQMEMFSYNPGLDAEQRKNLCNYLVTNDMITVSDGVRWIKRQQHDAMIWVNKNTKNTIQKETK